MLAGVLTAVLVSGGTSTAKAQPTRKDLTAAMLSLRQVRDAFGTGWSPLALTGSGDPFCPQFTLAEPSRSVDALYSTVEGDDGAGAAFYEVIASFDSATDADKYYEQEKAISENCSKSEGHFGTTPVTYEITDITREADAVGHEVIAARYEARPTDGSSTEVVLIGYIVETKMERLVLATNYYVFSEPTETEIEDYYDLTKVAFDKAAAAL